MAKDVDIVPAIKTDYSAITLQLHRTEDGNKGPSFWKMNTSLFYSLKKRRKTKRYGERRLKKFGQTDFL